jgi:hypothetical protein
LHVANKTVPLFACPEAGDHCPVHVIDLYIGKLPQIAIENDTFFVKQLENTPEDDTKPWYSRTPVGRNTLNTRLGKMCFLAGIEGHITNHSMCATSVTQMYATGVPEKVIQERTGHRSQRTNSDQHQMVSNVLSDPQEKCYNIRQTQKSVTQKIINMEPPSTQQGMTISLKNLHGCTINIHNYTASQPIQTLSVPSFDLSPAELDELVTDF